MNRQKKRLGANKMLISYLWVLGLRMAFLHYAIFLRYFTFIIRKTQEMI